MLSVYEYWEYDFSLGPRSLKKKMTYFKFENIILDDEKVLNEMHEILRTYHYVGDSRIRWCCK